MRTQMIFNRKTEDSGTEAITIEPVTRLGLARAAQPARNGLPARALIDTGLNVKGDLETEGELQIDGQIVGNISCGHLVIGKEGAVRGDIKADEVGMRGKTEGMIRERVLKLRGSASGI